MNVRAIVVHDDTVPSLDLWPGSVHIESVDLKSSYSRCDGGESRVFRGRLKRMIWKPCTAHEKRAKSLVEAVLPVQVRKNKL